MVPFVLASASPRRKQFLAELGFAPEIVPANIDETARPAEDRVQYVRRLAREKAATVAALRPHAIVVAADTVVIVDGTLLGKPVDAEDFRRMMSLLSGRTHQVVTAVAVLSPAEALRETAVSTDVTFRSLGRTEVDWYWSSGEPLDKAGGYALQGLGGSFITGIRGSHSNVIGLPLVETLALLEQAGIRAPWTGG